MSLYDDILNGTYNKNKSKATYGIRIKDEEESELYQAILNGTYKNGETKASYIDFSDDEEDKEEKKKEEQDESGWIKSSKAFKDEEGSIIGDIGKTVLGTVGDIGSHLTKGIMNIGEGIGDLASYGIAQIKENQGNKDEADEIRKRAQENSINDFFEGNLRVKDNENSIADDIFNNISSGIGEATSTADDYSILGNKSDNIVEGLGYVAGMTAIGIATGGAGTGVATAATTATTFSSAMGQGMTQAYQDGADDDDAWKFGVISGLAEAGSELLFGGLGKASGALGLSKGISSVDDVLATKVSGIFKSTIAKNLSEYVIKAGAEGTEEVISGFIQALGQKATYKSEEDWKKLVKDQNLLEQFVSGAITSAIAQVPGQNGIYKTTKNSRDFISGLTQNEAKVYDKELSSRTDLKVKETAIEKAYNEQIKVQEKLGVDLSEEDKNTIRQAVEEAYESGKIDNNTKISSKEYEELENQVRKDLEDGNISLDTIRETIGENEDISKDDFLKRSYYEEEQKNTIFKFEQTDNEKVNNLYQSAADSGMNNHNKTRKKIELIAKLTKDTDRQYKFVSPEQLKEMGYNENANGLIDKNSGEILINSRSGKGIQAIIGHETTHIFDSTDENGNYSKEYKKLQDFAIEYAKEKGIFTERVKNIINDYDGIVDNYNQVKEELTADLMGDFLFNDEKFIENLSVKDKNIFEKIYDYIKHTIKLATASSDEAKQLENLKYQFDKVYKTISEETNTDIKYSAGGIEGLINVKDNEFKNKAYDNYKKAKEMAKNKESNEKIFNDTGWFQDKVTKKMKFIFSDKDMEVYDKNYTVGKEYKLKDIMKHDTLFEMYPKLEDYTVIIKDMNANKDNKNTRGSHNRYTDTIELDYRRFNNKLDAEGTLIHEVQHAIQKIEGFARGTGTEWGNNFYKNNPGEMEARETAKRMEIEKTKNKDLSNILPKYAKKNISPIDKMKIGLYNYLKDLKNGGVDNDTETIIQENNEKDSRQNESISLGGYLNESTNYEESENNSGSFSMDNKGRNLSKEQQERYKDISQELRDENGNLKNYYHGTKRADRVGNIFDPNKATSGPMAFFTDNEDIAKDYSINKEDTSLSREYDTEYDLFKIDNKSLDEYWNSLSKDQQNRINEAGYDIGFDEDYENIIHEKDASKNSFSSQYEYYLKNEENNNGIKALYDVFIQDGNLMFEDMNKFEDVLKFAGINNVKYLDPYKTDSKVYNVYLNIKNPFNTNKISNDMIEEFKKASKDAKTGESYSADMWDKSNITPEDWLERLENDLENGTSHAWTSIPDWVTDILKKNGFDGIVDTGGKNGGIEHQVVIPFYSNQIKNIDNTTPTDNPDIRLSMTKNNQISGDDIAVKDMLVQNNNNIEDAIGNNKENTNILQSEENNSLENASQPNLKTKARNYISRSKTKFKNDVVAKFGTSKIANTNLLNSTVEKIQNDIISNNKLNKEQIDNYFNELYDNLKKIDTAYYDEYKDVKSDIRNTRFYVPDNVRNDISDYNLFRQNNMGNIILTNNPENISIDTKYKELSEIYPELFPRDIVNNSEQLQKIAEVTKDIAKVETNVSAYNDQYMGKEYRNWAKEEFGTAISNLTQDIHDAMRYNEDTTPSEQISYSKDEVKNIYKLLPDAKKKYEKALAKEVLTKQDRIQVDRLLNGEIDISELSKDSNQEGIIRLATAKSEYDALQKSIDSYVKNIKQARIDQAEQDVGDLNRWKDKKIGFQYSRETPIRNIYDIAPKEIADKIADKYFRSYIEVNEKKVVDNITSYNEQIKELDISTKNKYKIEYEGQKHKVSESALIQLLGEKKITTEQIQEAGADVKKIENAVNKFRSIYNELIDQINESMLDNGYAPMEYRKDYFPHFTEETSDTLLGKAAKLIGIDINNKEDLPTDISGQTMNFKPGRTWFSNMLQRTTDVTDYDVLKGFDKYIRGASDLIYHTNDIQNLRALSSVIRGTYNDTEIQNKIVEIQESTSMNDLEKSEAIQKIYETAKDRSHLSKFIEYLDNYTNLLAGKKSINDRSSEKELNRQMYSTMQSIESRFAANAIGGNVGVALTNFAPLAQATGETKLKYLAAGMWQTMKASIKGDSSFASESQFITRRRGTEYLSQTTTDKITNMLTAPLEFADNFTSEAIVRAKYMQNLQEGMTEQTALEEADRYTAGLMADRSRGALPTQFNNKNPIAKMINMFQVEVNNQWSYYFKDLPKNVQESGKNNLVGAYTKIMLGSYLMNEILGSIRGNSTRVLPDPIYIIKEFIKGLSDDDDDNDADTILSTLSEIAGNMPFVSLPATLLGAEDVGRVPLAGMIPDLKDIVGNVTDVANGEKTIGEGISNISGELLDTLGSSLITPFGGAQIKKTIKGLDLYSPDKPTPGSYTDNGDLRYTVDEDVGSVVKSAVFGAYANPYAQDYIKSGFKTIKSNNIDELVGLNMNSTEYRKYKKELNAAGNTSDKNGYKQYTDNNGNIYWYDDKNEIIYDSNYNETEIDKKDLTKVSKTEEQLNYINSLDLTNEQKNIMASNINKNSKKTIDLDENNNYDSYNEYKYAEKYPEKYNVISLIDTYDNFNTYKNDINEISKEYKELSQQATSNKEKRVISKQKKQEIQNYINGLDLNQYQKMMLEKEVGGYSIKNYKTSIYKYLEEQDLTDEEKYNIWEELFN